MRTPLLVRLGLEVRLALVHTRRYATVAVALVSSLVSFILDLIIDRILQSCDLTVVRIAFCVWSGLTPDLGLQFCTNCFQHARNQTLLAGTHTAGK